MQGTQSIGRAIQLLRLFDDEKPNRTLHELIDETGLKKTTVFRMLTALKNEGLLEYHPNSGTWGLGSELILLGGRAMRQHRLRDVANEPMRKLSRQTGESVTLDVLWIDDDQVPFTMVIDEDGSTPLLIAHLPHPCSITFPRGPSTPRPPAGHRHQSCLIGEGLAA